MTTLEELQRHLTQRLPDLAGEWVRRNSGYEGVLAERLAMNVSGRRYWDATWGPFLIEFKKGRSIWLDLVRYSEILLGASEDACRETFCLFFVPNQDRTAITEIIGVKTSALIERLQLTRDDGETLLHLQRQVPRSLNAQASLTVSDVRGLREFVVRAESTRQQCKALSPSR